MHSFPPSGSVRATLNAVALLGYVMTAQHSKVKAVGTETPTYYWEVMTRLAVSGDAYSISQLLYFLTSRYFLIRVEEEDYAPLLIGKHCIILFVQIPSGYVLLLSRLYSTLLCIIGYSCADSWAVSELTRGHLTTWIIRMLWVEKDLFS